MLADALRASEERYRLLANLVPDQVWTAGEDGGLDYVNDRVLEYFGSAYEDMLADGWTAVVHPEDLPAVLESWSHSLKTGEGYTVSFRLRRADGMYRWHIGRALPHRDATGKLQWFGSNTDVHQLRETEAALDAALAEVTAANGAKADFLASMSHDLRTPLNAIMGYARLVADGMYGPVNDKQVAVLTRVQQANNHLLTLINDILSFSKLEAGNLELQIQPLPVARALQPLRGLIEPQLEEKGLIYEERAGPTGTSIMADVDRVTQILLNLLTNAVKFTDSGGRVSVAWDVAPETVRIHVHDTGSGIPGDQLEEVFDSFVQRTGSRHAQRRGVGLGLAISRKLARAMNGELTVASEPGRGSIFTLHLPRA